MERHTFCRALPEFLSPTVVNNWLLGEGSLKNLIASKNKPRSFLMSMWMNKSRGRECLAQPPNWLNKQSPFKSTQLGTNICPTKALLNMNFLFKHWDMIVAWRVYNQSSQIIIFHRNKGSQLRSWATFWGPRSCEVATIWPDLHTLQT